MGARSMGTTTILHDAYATEAEGDVVDERVLVAPEGFAVATGWVLEPEGLCRGEVCVPVKARPDVVVDGMIDAVAVAGLLRVSVVADAAERVVAYGPSAAAVSEDLGERRAADFTLPELDGTELTFSALGRKKKLLVVWASW